MLAYSSESSARVSEQAAGISAALIIPALNEEPVIGRTLASIPQGLFDQIIVADNGSTDRTAEPTPPAVP